jgi:alpha-beta hydrolase superfamily lysophospholipase
MFSLPTLMLLFLIYVRIKVFGYYVPRIARIFQEKPLFIVPRGQPRPEAESVRFRSTDGLTLNGCYYKGEGDRRGVILFGLEFGSDCWSCWSYCERLVANGFDVFAFETRNQGKSDSVPDYEPLQWVTDAEVRDTEAAVAYLKKRPDADPRGIGLFGISKGAGAGVLVAAQDPYIRCCVTDGMFATATTLYPYMLQWFTIYNTYYPPVLIPDSALRMAARCSLRYVERERGCRFPYLEKAMPRLVPRPILMIHGGQDTYIKPEMARALYDLAGEPKEFWLVEKAKHNQALSVAGEMYHQRVLRFFEKYLAEDTTSPFLAENDKGTEATRQDAMSCEPALGH